MVAPGPGYPPPGPPGPPGYPPQPMGYGQGPACPRCQNTYCSTPGFTWWGGFLGPKIIPHLKCSRCQFSFNPKTGQPITGAIVIYSVVVGVIVLVIFGVLLGSMH